MSWASRRETTREEDRAYCLLGILDVSMPLLYGEGGEAAFQRLQLEILKQSDDESIFAWSTDDATSDLLAEHPFCFTYSANVACQRFVDRPPYAMANKGLRMELGVRHVSFRHRDLFCSVLNCGVCNAAGHVEPAVFFLFQGHALKNVKQQKSFTRAGSFVTVDLGPDDGLPKCIKPDNVVARYIGLTPELWGENITTFGEFDDADWTRLARDAVRHWVKKDLHISKDVVLESVHVLQAVVDPAQTGNFGGCFFISIVEHLRTSSLRRGVTLRSGTIARSQRARPCGSDMSVYHA